MPETEPCVYGTTRPINSYNPIWAQVETYVDLIQLARKAPTTGDAIKVFFASPAWRPAWMGESLKRDFSRKYDPQGSPATVRYALFNWVLLLGGVFSFLMWGAALSGTSKSAAVVVVLLSVVSLPALVEGRTWAKALEGARLLCLPIALTLIVLVR
jgi:hypothetical protein